MLFCHDAAQIQVLVETNATNSSAKFQVYPPWSYSEVWTKNDMFRRGLLKEHFRKNFYQNICFIIFRCHSNQSYYPSGTKKKKKKKKNYLFPRPIHLTTLITSPIDFLLYFQNCPRYKYNIFKEVIKIYRTNFTVKIMRISHCFFVPQVFRHNNPHFQKLQNWTGLR